MNPSDIQRFFDKVRKSDNCWEWTGGKDKDGYGQFWVSKKNVRAHRFSYELLKGDIPEGMQIDHLCRNHSCVNHEHLEVVTLQENIKRGMLGKITHYNTKKTHCKRGHEFTEENTYVGHNNDRTCRKCRVENNDKYRLKLKVRQYSF